MNHRTPFDDLYDSIVHPLQEGSNILQSVAPSIGTSWKTRTEIMNGLKEYFSNVESLSESDILILEAIDQILYLEKGYFFRKLKSIRD
jgi:hypothetical protein